MPFKPSSFFSLIVLTSLNCFAQKQSNFWPMGVGLGMDFSYNRFTAVQDIGTTVGNFASICDAETGMLLFYTDGRKVWNANFDLMPNGTGLRGGTLTSQAALIIPFPNRPKRFLLFTTKAVSDSIRISEEDHEFTGLYYSVVDMALDNGRGDVATKNQLLLERSTEKLTAVPHANGRDFWLLSHEHATNRFVVYLVTEDGVGEPHYFALGHVNTAYPEEGWLAPSPDGSMIACAPGAEQALSPLELYDFDRSTGSMSNLRELGDFPSTRGVCFSPDNTKLYLAYADEKVRGNTVQFDLNLEAIEDIRSSMTELKFIFPTGLTLNDTLAGGRMQIAPDGRIYTELSAEVYTSPGSSDKRRLVFFLDKPNLPGLECQPAYRELEARAERTTVFGVGIPNFTQYQFDGLDPVDNFIDKSECGHLEPLIFPNPSSSQLNINFGDERCVFPVEISLYTISGHLLLSRTFYSPPTPSLDLGVLPSSVYVLLLKTPFQLYAQKIIKE